MRLVATGPPWVRARTVSAARLMGWFFGEGLQPAGHALDRDEDRAGEYQREDGQEAGELGGFGVGDGEPDQGEHPRQGVAE